MRKIFIILCCFGILSAHATEMCARDDTVVIPLDATINATGSSANQTEAIFWVVNNYGTYYAAAASLSKKEIMMYSDWNGTGTLPANFTLKTASDELIGSSGYYMNADVNPDIPDAEKNDYARIYCCLKITHPMSSSWVCFYNYNSPNSIGGCISVVGAEWTRTNQIQRTALFNSIGTTPPWPLD